MLRHLALGLYTVVRPYTSPINVDRGTDEVPHAAAAKLPDFMEDHWLFAAFSSQPWGTVLVWQKMNSTKSMF